MKIAFASIIEKIQTMKDRSIKIDISTNELSPEDKAKVFNFQDAYCWTILVSEENEIENIKVPELPEREETMKSPSEYQKDLIYVLYKKSKAVEPFDIFYLNEMKRIADYIKAKISKYD